MTDNAELFFNSLSTTAAVQALVGSQENLNFEAKTCSLPLSKDDKINLAKALSGFANSEGGVLVYGLVAKGGDRDKADVVTSVDPVRKLDLLESAVLSLVGQIVEPPVPGVGVQPRQLSQAPNTGFLLLYVPRSESFLHRSRLDHEYYRRHGYGFFKMEHHEIAEFYGRRKSPRLNLWWGVRCNSYGGASPNRRFSVNLIVGLENTGRGIAKYPALLITSHVPERYGLDGSGHDGLPARPTVSGGSLFGGGGDDVVHPGTVLEVTALKPKLDIREEDALGSIENDVNVAFEIYAEDMAPLRRTLQIPRSEIAEKVLKKCGRDKP